MSIYEHSCGPSKWRKSSGQSKSRNRNPQLVSLRFSKLASPSEDLLSDQLERLAQMGVGEKPINRLWRKRKGLFEVLSLLSDCPSGRMKLCFIPVVHSRLSVRLRVARLADKWGIRHSYLNSPEVTSLRDIVPVPDEPYFLVVLYRGKKFGNSLSHNIFFDLRRRGLSGLTFDENLALCSHSPGVLDAGVRILSSAVNGNPGNLGLFIDGGALVFGYLPSVRDFVPGAAPHCLCRV